MTTVWSSSPEEWLLLRMFLIALTLCCIGLSFWALQAFRFDLFLKSTRSPQAKTLMILLSVVMGYLLSQFLITYASWAFTIL